MKKFNQLTERQMSKANGGIIPLLGVALAGVVGGLGAGATITSLTVLGTNAAQAKGK